MEIRTISRCIVIIATDGRNLTLEEELLTGSRIFDRVIIIVETAADVVDLR